jgi:predicted amidohydrolase YtcJ
MHTGLVACGWRIDLAGRSRAETLDALRAAVDARGAGEWIVGDGWDESAWKERRYLVREELDRIAPKSPLLAIRMDGHLSTANSRALEELPLAVPERLVERDTGHLREAAVLEATRQVTPDRSTSADALDAAAHLCHRLGVTAVHTMSRLRVASDLMAGRAERRLRVTLCPDVQSFDTVERAGLCTGFGDPWLRFGGIKIFADGSIGARNAAVSEPFLAGGIGELNHESGEIETMIRSAEAAGWQTIVHAIGDRAIEQVLDVHRAVSSDRSFRHRIEHYELPSEGQIARVAELGLTLCMQPNFIGNWSGPGSLYVDRLGEARDRASNPLRRVVDAGVHLAFGSDGMPISPLYGLHWAVNGPYPDQRLTVSEAIERYTAASAWAGFTESDFGRIEPGLLADLVVLDEDPTARPACIDERTVEMTFVGGEKVYSAAEGSG